MADVVTSYAKAVTVKLLMYMVNANPASPVNITDGLLQVIN